MAGHYTRMSTDTLGRESRLASRLDAIASLPGSEIAGLAFVALEDGEPALERYLGRRRIVPGKPALDLPITAETRFRVASISKPFVALACLVLEEEGLIDLEADASEYLGWPLRNPAYPDAVITPAMLLSHTSSIRDIDDYVLPPGRPIRSFFESPSPARFAGACRPNGARGQGDAPDPRLAPGRYYEYCNLGYGLCGTMLERATGQRFDLLMRDRVLEPLGIGGSFNPRLLSDEGLTGLSALYRRGLEPGSWDERGDWLAQVDDCHGRRPTASPSDEEIAAYVPGTNASWLSPQGGLRASALEVARLATLIMDGGRIGGRRGERRLLSERGIDRMRRTRWAYDPAAGNGALENGRDRSCGLGWFRTTDAADGRGSDRLRPEGGLIMEGHHAEAYGLIGGLLVDPERRLGFAYLINGTAVPPSRRPGRFSSYYLWKEEIQAAAVEFLYP